MLATILRRKVFGHINFELLFAKRREVLLLFLLLCRLLMVRILLAVQLNRKILQLLVDALRFDLWIVDHVLVYDLAQLLVCQMGRLLQLARVLSADIDVNVDVTMVDENWDLLLLLILRDHLLKLLLLRLLLGCLHYQLWLCPRNGRL